MLGLIVNISEPADPSLVFGFGHCILGFGARRFNLVISCKLSVETSLGVICDIFSVSEELEFLTYKHYLARGLCVVEL